ncbi:MAG: AAA family ATPase, partial [Chloroflexi bacterium]|nr:AAA family ATPase [Chloroflexota bacterium]
MLAKARTASFSISLMAPVLSGHIFYRIIKLRLECIEFLFYSINQFYLRAGEMGTIKMGKQIIAICGKGGVGKTSFSSLLGRSLIDYGIRPILFVDADPVMGLTFAIGEHNSQTLSDVRDELIISARATHKAQTEHIVDQIDYLVLKTLVEREHYSLLAMGHSSEKGCFCPANSLLRNAIDL